MNITIIFGSVRQSSLTRTLAHCLADCLLMRDASLNWVDLREQPLSIVDPDYHSHVEDNPSAAVRQFIKKIAAADGVILASPLYQGSYSGVLKNALDHLTYDAFLRKPIGLISHGSTVQKCAQPCEHLLPVVRTLYGYPLQCQVTSAKQDFASDDEGRT
ncbi:NADPH-dependent FMN reductase [Bartonella henselae]|uniref:NADPH-dependent FMN reductase n=1 Tax=Bartonella henselae TaxID=38323 RepID=X5MIH0_BARHN|nr:NAD(P)H-dependent oxidoreductase [Bartonella henselae]MDM9996602.1 NAD(P)H-dependent oxidoreductase [Bartonella henselae]CDO47655.1 NADPH-dependent FMN reductase [Bartonella henselae]